MTNDFSFAHHARARDFDAHIRASIPGYDQLIDECIGLSRSFIQPGTTVLDIGCSTGHMLASVEKGNSRRDVTYVGVDSVAEFSDDWRQLSAKNLRFEVCDARSYRGFRNVSLAFSLFTLQFIPPLDKLLLLQAIYNGLVAGGSLLIAEKVLASTPRLQDALTFPYYDFKHRQGFSSAEILEKERSLRGQMTLWMRGELETALRDVGFRELESIWERFPFVAVLALK